MSHVNHFRGSQDLRRKLGDLRNTMRWNPTWSREHQRARDEAREIQTRLYEVEKYRFRAH